MGPAKRTKAFVNTVWTINKLRTTPCSGDRVKTPPKLLSAIPAAGLTNTGISG
jgi:hypothetical protein